MQYSWALHSAEYNIAEYSCLFKSKEHNNVVEYSCVVLKSTVILAAIPVPQLLHWQLLENYLFGIIFYWGIFISANQTKHTVQQGKLCW